MIDRGRCPETLEILRTQAEIYSRKTRGKLEVDDLVSRGWLQIEQIQRAHDPERSSWKTYFALRINYAFQDYARLVTGSRRAAQEIPQSTIPEGREERAELEPAVESGEHLWNTVELGSVKPRERYLFRLLAEYGVPPTQLAVMMGDLEAHKFITFLRELYVRSQEGRLYDATGKITLQRYSTREMYGISNRAKAWVERIHHILPTGFYPCIPEDGLVFNHPFRTSRDLMQVVGVEIRKSSRGIESVMGWPWRWSQDNAFMEVLSHCSLTFPAFVEHLKKFYRWYWPSFTYKEQSVRVMLALLKQEGLIDSHQVPWLGARYRVISLTEEARHLRRRKSPVWWVKGDQIESLPDHEFIQPGDYRYLRWRKL